MTGITDRMDLGIFPLQDHAAGPDKVPVSMRQSLAGVRISKMKDPSKVSSAADSMVEYAREDGLGTIGDIHPWSFWQTADREKRGMGAWSMAWAAMVKTADSKYAGQTRVYPFKDDGFVLDDRFKGKEPAWPRTFPALARGAAVMIMPGTDEDEQHDLAFYADPRLVAPDTSGPGEAGTLVVDLQPTGELCMDKARAPGMGGRHARLQSLIRVIAMPAGGLARLSAPGNILALNYTRSGVDSLAGYGAVFARLAGPSTPGGGQTNSPGSSEGEGGKDTTADTFGKFQVKPRPGHGIAFMSSGASGPLHPGGSTDQHQFGKDADGHPINSGHISYNAYFYRSDKEDGPFKFEGAYPYPPPYPLKTRTHLSWDAGEKHPWLGGVRQGKWRWWSEAPYKGKGGPPTKLPKRPSEPPPGPPTITPGWPGAPGTPRPGIPGPPPPPPPPDPPRTPWPEPPPPIGGPGGGPDPDDPLDYPVTPRTRGPITFGGYDPTGRLGRLYRERLRILRLGGSGGWQPPREPESGGAGAGPGSGGTEIVDPLQATGRLSGIDPATGLPDSPPGVLERVGDGGPETVGAYSIYHPLHESFAALAFRPQLWVAGYPNYEHNPQLPEDLIEADQDLRPQVLTARAWGAQTADGEWSYQEGPWDSRAHGGRTLGGILFSTPQFEMEDYFDIGAAQDVKANTGIEVYILAAPGVAFALGTPTTGGALNPKSVVVAQKPVGSHADEDFFVAQVDSGGSLDDLIRARSSAGTVTLDFMGDSTTWGSVIALAPDGIDKAWFYHDNSNAHVKWTDGALRFQTDEGSDTTSVLEVRGKGDQYGMIRLFDQDSAEYLAIYALTGGGFITTLGTTPGDLHLQYGAHADLRVFAGAASGEIRELKIYGFKVGDAKRALEIGVGVDEADTVTFDGVSNYLFDGTIKAWSPDHNDHVRIEHDNDNVRFYTTDGYFIFKTDKGTNNNTFVSVIGKGTGYGGFLAYDQDNAEYLQMWALSGAGYINTGGVAPGNLHLQSGAHAHVTLFASAAEWETRNLIIYGHRSGDPGGRRSLEIGVGVDADDTASFDGVSNYYFDGKVGIGIAVFPPTHSLTVQSVDEETLRLIGPDLYGAGARLNFGDLDEVYIEEDLEQKLFLYGLGRTAIMGGNVGVNTIIPAYRLDVNGEINATGYRAGGVVGVSGTFEDLDGNTVTVTNGLITDFGV